MDVLLCDKPETGQAGLWGVGWWFTKLLHGVGYRALGVVDIIPIYADITIDVGKLSCCADEVECMVHGSQSYLSGIIAVFLPWPVW